MKILVTGASGFIAGYMIQELLDHNHHVIGIDNFSKYGPINKSYDNHPNYEIVNGDVKNLKLMKDLIDDCDQIIAGAAMIGGISYFHEYAYDLLAENERIIATTFDAAIWANKNKHLRKINVLSSSMVFESTNKYPTPEEEVYKSPPPISTYGFQKLSVEYFAKGAWEQYKLPYTIIRPFNCIGIGEKRAIGDVDIASGNVKLAMSHVVPDLIQKILKGQDPLHILGDGSQKRHYTYGGDLAEGIRLCVEKDTAINEDFNISTDVTTSVLDLAKIIWDKINTNPFSYVSDEPYLYDVQERIPSVKKAEKVLGFKAKTDLSDAIDLIIPWIKKQIEIKGI
jgi:UDP-glucose 4-epimerase